VISTSFYLYHFNNYNIQFVALSSNISTDTKINQINNISSLFMERQNIELGYSQISFLFPSTKMSRLLDRLDLELNDIHNYLEYVYNRLSLGDNNKQYRIHQILLDKALSSYSSALESLDHVAKIHGIKVEE
jgi:hypothetical protein